MVDVFQPTLTAPQGATPTRGVGGGSPVVGGLSVLAGIIGDVATDVRANRKLGRENEALGLLQSTFQEEPEIETQGTAETEASLKALGHKIVHKEVCGMGATVARRDPDTGMLSTGADQRRSCYAIGW